MSSLADVSHAIARSVEQHRRTRRRLVQMRGLLALVDRLLSDLEELHLIGKSRVPLNYAERLDALTEVLPPAMRRPLRPGVTIVHLMDELFAIQEDLLREIAPPIPDDAA
jgi:hypothetical protein